MSVLKSIAIAFSMYSQIPVPQFAWEEKDMRYVLCFFPWVGIVIGLLFYGWGWICIRYQIGSVCASFVGAAIPLVISGGFHVDGFMDTMDAFHSYQPREKKLEILKDSHIGAFSVIMLVLYYLIYVGALSEVRSLRYTAVLAFGFFMARCLSGIGVVSFCSAKQEGLLYTFASGAQKWTVRVTLLLQFVLGSTSCMRIAPIPGFISVGVTLASFAYFRVRSYRELGGITGDTAGYFVTICEAALAIAAAACCVAGL